METQRLDLPIGGMSCAGCASRIEKELQSLPGVQQGSQIAGLGAQAGMPG